MSLDSSYIEKPKQLQQDTKKHKGTFCKNQQNQ